MSAPVSTQNAAGNVRASASLAASAVSTTATFNLSTKFSGAVQFGATFGTVAATAGLQIDCYRMVGSTPVSDTDPFLTFVLPAVASTFKARSIVFDTYQYQFKFTNLDGTNGLTAVYATADTVDSVS